MSRDLRREKSSRKTPSHAPHGSVEENLGRLGFLAEAKKKRKKHTEKTKSFFKSSLSSGGK
jgi:hypothetical protein